MTFSVGPVELPTVANGGPTLADLDPARDVVLKLFRAAIIGDLSARWDEVVSKTQLKGTSIVSEIVPHNPDPQHLQENKYELPALFCYRFGEPQSEDYTIWEERYITQMRLDFILPPLDTADLRRIADVLRGIHLTAINVIKQGGHPGYLAGVNVLTDKNGPCRFDSVKIERMLAGPAAFSDEPPYYQAASIMLRVAELVEPGTGALISYPLEGLDFGGSTTVVDEEGESQPLLEIALGSASTIPDPDPEPEPGPEDP